MPSDKSRALELSTRFDYKSIMIYSSLPGTAKPICRTLSGELIWMGGNADPELGGLSQLDVERVARLYPKHVKPPGKPSGKRSSDANAMEVVLPGELTTTIRPVPTDFPRSADDSNASQTGADTQVAKRWFSLPTSQEPRSPSKFGLWPACDGVHVVTFCFENQNTYNLIGLAFLQAIALWTPAIVRSSLGFAPDPACIGAPGICLCSMGVDEVTLHVQLSPDDTFRSSFGYLDPLVQRHDLHKPRHLISIASDEKWSWEFAVLMIAHHLGEMLRLMSFRKDRYLFC
jgi:hypothetical protein